MAEVKILYLATADGLHQLANPGKSNRWRRVGVALEGQDVGVIRPSPNDPLLVYAAATDGIFRTTNGGASWEAVLPQPVATLVFDDSDLVATTVAGETLRSGDGESWEPSAPIAASTEHKNFTLAGLPPALLIPSSGVLMRSEDGGATTIPVEGPRAVQVLVNPPRFQDYVYAGTEAGELWLSKDRGATWARLEDGFAAIRDLAFARVQ